MRVTADTNVLLRALLGDNPDQSPVAADLLRTASQIIVTPQTLCELAWVLKSGYRRKPGEIAETMRRLLAADNVSTDRAAAELGLNVLARGGDFADGVIAYEGLRLGADQFATFDRDVASILSSQGLKVLTLLR